MAANAGSSSLPVGTWSAESLPRRDSKTPRARSWLGTFVSSASSWTGTRSAPAADPVAAPETLETAPAQIEHFLVIPTFGYRIPGTSTWHIDVRGWVYQIKQNSVRKRFIKSLTKRIFSRTIEADPQTALVHLDRRLDMYLTRTAECTVNASLAAGPMDPAKEDMHPHEVRRDGVEPKVQPDPPSPRSPVTKHPGNVSPTTMGPVTLEFTGAVEGDGDQALDAMLEDDDEEEVEEEEIEETTFPEVQDGLEGKFRSDDNGNFHGSFQVEDAIVSKWRDSPATKKAHGHMHIKIGVSRDRQEYDAFGSAELLSDTGVSLISDVDDTIKHSNIGSGASAMFANAMLEAAQELPGMTETYNKLWKAGAAIHYVSAAPWQVGREINCSMDHGYKTSLLSLRSSRRSSIFSASTSSLPAPSTCVPFSLATRVSRMLSNLRTRASLNPSTDFSNSFRIASLFSSATRVKTICFLML